MNGFRWTMVTEYYVSTARRPGEGVTVMLAVLFLVLLLACILAPWLGEDTADSRSEAARPDRGWFPLITRR